MQIESKSESETKKIAKKLIAGMREFVPIFLFGGLGSGKTVFVKGIASALGISERKIKSPTFTYTREIALPHGKKLHHMDLYRLHGHFDHLEIEDIIKRGDALVIEWSEHLKGNLPAQRIEVHFKITGERRREIKIVRESGSLRVQKNNTYD